MRITPAEARHLHVILADLASGTPRQWWHLEIAARLTDGLVRWPIRWLGIVLARFNIGQLLPLLSQIGLTGLRPYRLGYRVATARWLGLSSLFAICLLGLLIGLGSLNATRQLLLILLALFGSAGTAMLVWHDAQSARQSVQQRQQQESAFALPAESVIGLVGQLCAAGLDPALAPDTAARLASHPDSLSADEAWQFGLSAPASSEVWLASVHAAGLWLAGVIAIAWPCWLTGARWQFVPALLGLWLVHFVHAAPNTAWWRRAIKPTVAGLLCLGLGLLKH